MELPKFKYHPDPISTGAIKSSCEACECCGRSRGYVYNSTIYAVDDVEHICPWCIADGSAAKKFEGVFSDDHPLLEAGVDARVVEEVCERTPGFNSWQQEVWQVHCQTACEFHGDAEKSELLLLSGDQLKSFLAVEMIKPETWEVIVGNYQKGGSPAVYKYICNECRDVVYTMDFA